MLIVQKYGGTSVADLDRIENVAIRVAKEKAAGNDIVVVVSAMSGQTNELTGFAKHFDKNPSKKEMDMLLSSGERITASLLAIALQSKGYDSVAMTGRQAGILTDDSHTYARIKSINTAPMQKAIAEGKIVVVAGFQGISESANVTTLGRGGSDLSAVAIAGALKADQCEIYSDVDGVYTTDPRIQANAKKLDSITYDEMLELSSLGAKVLQNRSVELAKKLNVKLYAKNSFNNNKGTLITKEKENMEEVLVSGIALDRNQARVTLRGVSDKPGIAAKIFSKLANENINIDMIVQNVGTDNTTNLGFTVTQSEMENAKEVIKEFTQEIQSIDFDENICKVSIVGVGMKSHSGVAAKAFITFANNKINIQMISTSEIKISTIINEKYAELAVRVLHDTFELEK